MAKAVDFGIPSRRTLRALGTKLDKNVAIRSTLIKRIETAIRREDIPVAVLHQVAQCIEMWGDDNED